MADLELVSLVEFTKRLENNYSPLRRLTQPFILRRLKTDKRIICDLPDKTEIKVYCHLTAGQVAGSTLRYHNGLKRLVRLTGLPLSEAVRCTALNQAESLGLGKRGRIENDYIADIALLDSSLDVQMTLVNGIVLWKR